MKVFQLIIDDGNPLVAELPYIMEMAQLEAESGEFESMWIKPHKDMTQEELDALPEWDGP